MRAFVAAAIALAGLAAWPAAAQNAAPAVAPAPSTVESLRQAMRTDKRGLVERNMQLNAQEAAKFWPIYDTYQDELDRIMQRENRAILGHLVLMLVGADRLERVELLAVLLRAAARQRERRVRPT